METQEFDYEFFKRDTLEKMKNDPHLRLEQVFKPLYKQFFEAVLDVEMENHLTEAQREQEKRRGFGERLQPHAAIFFTQ